MASSLSSELDPDERDEVGIPDAMGRVQKTIIISEPGLYNLSKGAWRAIPCWKVELPNTDLLRDVIT
jgi:hypothetical protein